MVTLSIYQQAVIDWVKAHITVPGALIVEAVAGSGKTFTIVKAAQLIPTSAKAAFLAFNKTMPLSWATNSRSTLSPKHSTHWAGHCAATVSASTSPLSATRLATLSNVTCLRRHAR